MTNLEIVKALEYLAPKAEWVLSGDDYSKIEWKSSDRKPTLEEIEAEIAMIPTRENELKMAAEAKKSAVLSKLGISEDELRAVIG